METDNLATLLHFSVLVRRLSHRRQMRGSALEWRVKILFFDGWGTRGRRGIYFKYAHRHTQTHIARTTFSEERRDRFWLAAPTKDIVVPGCGRGFGI